MVKMDFAKVVRARRLHTPPHGMQGRCVLSKSKAKKEAPKTLVDDLVSRLEGAIFRGEFPPGSRVREARIASQLGVGRGPLREAVRRLEGRKLIVRHPNRGTFIATLTPAELTELLEVREALEVEACRLAAKRVTEEGLEKLRLTLRRQMEVEADKLLDLYSDWHNFDFHYQIALASGNQRLIDLLCGDIWCIMRLYRYPGILSRGRVPLGQADHEAILQALEARDPEACERQMRRHLAHAQETLFHTTSANSPSSRKKSG
jgi:DNA-binding GntR family transcriptional regulator